MVVRFFTEQVGLIPGVTNFIDIPPIAILAVVALVTSPDGSRPDRWPAYLAWVFFAFCAVGAVLNMTRIAPAPVLLFVYLFLAPVALYYMAYRIWRPDVGLSPATQTLVGLGLLQFAVILVFDLPDFLATENPDEIAGTFGGNAYQLVYFLLVFSALVAGAGVFARGRLTARLAPFLFGAAFLTIFLAQYRSLLATTILTVLFVGGGPRLCHRPRARDDRRPVDLAGRRPLVRRCQLPGQQVHADTECRTGRPDVLPRTPPSSCRRPPRDLRREPALHPGRNRPGNALQPCVADALADIIEQRADERRGSPVPKSREPRPAVRATRRTSPSGTRSREPRAERLCSARPRSTHPTRATSPCSSRQASSASSRLAGCTSSRWFARCA